LSLYVTNRGLFDKKPKQEWKEYANQEWILLKKQSGTSTVLFNTAENYIRTQQHAFLGQV